MGSARHSEHDVQDSGSEEAKHGESQAVASHLHGGLEGAVDLGGDNGHGSEAAGPQEVHAVHAGSHHRAARHRLGREPGTYVDPAQHLHLLSRYALRLLPCMLLACAGCPKSKHPASASYEAASVQRKKVNLINATESHCGFVLLILSFGHKIIWGRECKE